MIAVSSSTPAFIAACFAERPIFVGAAPCAKATRTANDAASNAAACIEAAAFDIIPPPPFRVGDTIFLHTPGTSISDDHSEKSPSLISPPV